MRERERQKANSVQAPFVLQWSGTASLPVTNISVQAGICCSQRPGSTGLTSMASERRLLMGRAIHLTIGPLRFHIFHYFTSVRRWKYYCMERKCINIHSSRCLIHPRTDRTCWLSSMVEPTLRSSNFHQLCRWNAGATESLPKVGRLTLPWRSGWYNVLNES